MKRYKHAQHALTELNITPLLDLVFVLLVIFIITTPQLMNSLEMNLPSGKQLSTPPPPQLRPHQIYVDAQGQASLDGLARNLASLREELLRLRNEDPELKVVVKGADEADYQGMINVLDILQRLDITRVGLATAGNGR
jgi:biopolymer transport protein ExbD